MRGRVVSKPRAEGGQGGLAGSPDVRRAASGQPPGEVGGATFDPHRRRLSTERWGGIAVSGSDLECFFPGVTAKPEDIGYQLIEQGWREVREVCRAVQIGGVDPDLPGPQPRERRGSDVSALRGDHLGRPVFDVQLLECRGYSTGRHRWSPPAARPTGLTVSPMLSILATSVWPLCR